VSLRLEIVEDVGNAIQKYTESFGYGVVRELVGHGLGKKCTKILKCQTTENAVAVNFYWRYGCSNWTYDQQRDQNIKQLKDGWTILTADGKPSAHFEHDVALIDGKPEILSTFAYVYQALGIVSNEEDEFRRVPLVL
jgi:methionyl aminopeptidase